MWIQNISQKNVFQPKAKTTINHKLGKEKMQPGGSIAAGGFVIIHIPLLFQVKG